MFALLDVTWQSGRLLSIALGGSLAVAVGIRPVFVGGGILLGVAAGVGLLTLPLPPTKEHDDDGSPGVVASPP